MDKYLNYAKFMNVQQDVYDWIDVHLAAYLKSNEENQTEIEHIIDFMASDKRPKRISRMSYEQAKTATEKWNFALVKKGCGIDEKPEDIAVEKDYGDGLKIVRLIGENAYKREGFLMRHCVSSYYGRDVKIYSLRDSDNMPHCTIEWGNQIKGKGNGSIHPKYVDYIVKFLEQTGMSVGDNEMKNIGYINIEKISKKIDIKKSSIYAKKYWHTDSKLISKDGGEYSELDILDYKPLIIESDASIKINFDLFSFVSNAVKLMSNVKNKKKFAEEEYSILASSGYGSRLSASSNGSILASSGNDSKLSASGNDSKLSASGYDSKLAASGGSSSLSASGNDSKLAASGYGSSLSASGNDSKLAASGGSSRLSASGYGSILASSGYGSRLSASGNGSILASSGNDSKLSASGYGSILASSGNDSKLAASGYGSRLSASGGGSNVIVSAEREAMVKGSLGTMICLTHYINEKPNKFITGKIGEDSLEADTWYELDNNGKFIKSEK